MRDAVSVRERRLAALGARARASAPTWAEAGLAALSAVLLVLSFPNFNIWPLAWVGLVPLLVTVARRRSQDGVRAFLLGWIAGTLFFYGSCYWLTYAMVRYGGIPSPIAYTLLMPGALVVGLFPGLCCLALARVVSRWGTGALFVAPFLWATLEWARLGVTGQLWNAIGYSQAYVPQMIQAARWGGVYMVGFFIVLVNAAIAYAVLRRKSAHALIISAVVVACVLVFNWWLGSRAFATGFVEPETPAAVVIALQPNVPMEPTQSTAESEELMSRHLSLSEGALGEWERRSASAPVENIPRVVVWPESPMNFTYTNDSEFRAEVARFSAKNRASVLFNSLEPAPAGGAYNAAVMVNEEGRVVAQYDKIRLLPFGEYVPLPRWLPGVNLVPALVGDFTPGAEYPLMPLGEARAGVFICFESAFPAIARRFAEDGADVLVNISNDGYLGPTPVMRQHLANTIFRAVETGRPVLRVTNTGITARITARGEVLDATEGFQAATRSWPVSRATTGKTFYTAHSDLFVGACAAISILILATTFKAFSFQRSMEE
ncbi:MAG: apolipoprotein N-acyltransferase [Pyrinomonadaceae bacterium]